MEEAAGKADNQPDSASKPKRAMTEEEMAAWADLLAVASELQFDQELDAGVPQEALPEDWERRLEPRTAAGPAGAGLG